MSTYSRLFNYEARVEKIRLKMEKQGIDILILNRLSSMFYVGGAYLNVYRPGAVIIIPLNGQVSMVARAMELDRLATETWIKNIKGWVAWDTNLYKAKSFVDCIADIFKENNLLKESNGTIGIEIGSEQEPGSISYGFYSDLANKFSNKKLVNASNILDEVVLVKEPEEIPFIRDACAILDTGHEAVLRALKVGVTEVEIAGVAEYAMRKVGMEWSVLQPMVFSGYRASYFNEGEGSPTTKIIQRGDAVCIDLMPTRHLYVGDIHFTVYMGERTDEQKRLSDTVEEIIEKIIELAKPGAVVADIDKMIREKKREKGYGDCDAWLTGHGLGLAPRCGPYFTPNNNTILEPNMIIEPIVLVFPPGVGGVGMEFPLLIGEKRPEVLTKTPLKVQTISI